MNYYYLYQLVSYIHVDKLMLNYQIYDEISTKIKLKIESPLFSFDN